MTRAEKASIAYQLVTHGPRVMGGDAVLSDDDFKFWNINYDFVAGYEQAEKDLSRPEEKPSEDLEEEVKRYYSDNFTYISSDQPTLSILTNVARHFAEWQKQRDAELIEIVYNDGITIGKTKQKEQMMKDAVEGEIVKDITNKLAVTAKNINLDGFKFGDKVKIIIVKED